MNRKSRLERLESLKAEERTMIFYEAPHKLCRTLADLRDAFGGGRRAALCRELTKMHEEVIRCTLDEACERYAETPPKGEFVVIVEGAQPVTEPTASQEDALSLMERYRSEGRSMKEAAKLAAADTGFSKNELYALALENK